MSVPGGRSDAGRAPARSPWLPPEQPTAPGADATPAPPDAPAAAVPAPAPPPRTAPWEPGRGAGVLAIPRWLVLLTALLLATAVGVALLLGLRGRTTTPPGTVTVAAPATSLSVHALRDPFVIDGARWAVFADPHQSWTLPARRKAPSGDRRWLLVAVRVRDITQRGLDPRALTYRVRGPGGLVLAPDPRLGTGPAAREKTSPLASGALGQAELAFPVPRAASQLTLTFPSRAHGGTTIVIPFGNA